MSIEYFLKRFQRLRARFFSALTSAFTTMILRGSLISLRMPKKKKQYCNNKSQNVWPTKFLENPKTNVIYDNVPGKYRTDTSFKPTGTF